MFTSNNYLCDTHTAVAVCCARKYINDSKDDTLVITASTASPYKFAKDVYKSLTDTDPVGDLEALNQLNKLTNVAIPYPLADIDKRTVRFTDVVDSDKMSKVVLSTVK